MQIPLPASEAFANSRSWKCEYLSQKFSRRLVFLQEWINPLFRWLSEFYSDYDKFVLCKIHLFQTQFFCIELTAQCMKSAANMRLRKFQNQCSAFLKKRFQRILPFLNQFLSLSSESHTNTGRPTMWSSGTKPQ